MILDCRVVFLFLCLLVTIRGHAQGDIQTKLQTLENAVDDVKQFSGDELNEYVENIQRIASNVLDLVNKAEKREKVPTLTIAEMIYYQTFESGVKGLEYYVELEAIKDGRSIQKVLPILAKVNKEKLSHKDANRLFNFLETMGLAIIKHREEFEIKAFYNDIGLSKFLSAIDDFKSKDLKNLCRKVLLNLMKEEGDIIRIGEAVHYSYEIKNLQDYAYELFELWKEFMVKSPISKLFDVSKIQFEGSNYNNITFEKLWQSSIGEDVQLKVLDEIWKQENYMNEHFFKDIISKIPYNDKDVKKMVKNSSLKFASYKLKEIKLNHLLENDPNNPSILALALDYPTDTASYNLDKIFTGLPENLLWLINRESFCLVSDGRFIYFEDLYDIYSLRVTKKKAKKPKSAVWNIIKNADYTNSNFEFCIKSNMTTNYFDLYIVFSSKDDNKLLINSADSGEITWVFNFTDSYTRTKIGMGEAYIKIEDDHLILDETPTIWNLVKC